MARILKYLGIFLLLFLAAFLLALVLALLIDRPQLAARVKHVVFLLAFAATTTCTLGNWLHLAFRRFRPDAPPPVPFLALSPLFAVIAWHFVPSPSLRLPLLLILLLDPFLLYFLLLVLLRLFR